MKMWVSLVLLVWVNDPDIVLARFGGTVRSPERTAKLRRIHMHVCEYLAKHLNEEAGPDSQVRCQPVVFPAWSEE